jgi:hypothetical protein
MAAGKRLQKQPAGLAQVRARRPHVGGRQVQGSHRQASAPLLPSA